jgi:hypothetical protein
MLAKSVGSSVVVSIGCAVVVASEPSPNKVPSKIAQSSSRDSADISWLFPPDAELSSRFYFAPSALTRCE